MRRRKSQKKLKARLNRKRGSTRAKTAAAKPVKKKGATKE